MTAGLGKPHRPRGLRRGEACIGATLSGTHHRHPWASHRKAASTPSHPARPAGEGPAGHQLHPLPGPGRRSRLRGSSTSGVSSTRARVPSYRGGTGHCWGQEGEGSSGGSGPSSCPSLLAARTSWGVGEVEEGESQGTGHKARTACPLTTMTKMRQQWSAGRNAAPGMGFPADAPEDSRAQLASVSGLTLLGTEWLAWASHMSPKCPSTSRNPGAPRAGGDCTYDGHRPKDVPQPHTLGPPHRGHSGGLPERGHLSAGQGGLGATVS